MPYAAVTDTHSAVVFFAGDRAYKLKKPVALGFLDFSAPEAGAAACRREVELNRRFPPDVYQPSTPPIPPPLRCATTTRPTGPSD